MTGPEVTVSELDALPADEAKLLLASCCGVSAWVELMADRRPFRDVETLLRVADEVWWSLGPEAWREMFAHHPRIGEQEAAAGQESRARAWSAGEQRGVADAGSDVRRAIAEGNRDYERRFGHIYLASAAGKSATELLEILRARLSNDQETELRVAAGEQAKITRSRLIKLFGATESPASPSAVRQPPSALT